MPRITLIGYRGTGKSTVASRLAALLGCGVDDADEALEKRVGCSIAVLIRDRGEPAFRDEESRVLADLLDRRGGVLSTGGGVVLRPANRELLRGRGRPVVWLTASPAVVHDRIAADPATPERRPSLVGPDGTTPADLMADVTAALATREPLYRECADVAIDTSSEPPDAVARRIVAWLAHHEQVERRAAGPADTPPASPEGRT